MTNIHDYLNGMAQRAGKDAIDNRKNEDLYESNMDYRIFYDNAKPSFYPILPPVVVSIIEPVILPTVTPDINMDFPHTKTRKTDFDSPITDWSNTIVRFD